MRLLFLMFGLTLSLYSNKGMAQNDSTRRWQRKFGAPAFFADSNRKNIRVTLLPGISSKKEAELKQINTYQFNILAGASAGNTNLEIGGLLNYNNGNVKGLQIAGLCNYVEGNSEGLQIAGVLNVVKGNAKGLQIGLVNWNDSASGNPMGFITHIKNGYQKLEVSMDEKQLWNFSYRTGTTMFQNIFILGVQSGQPVLIYTYGYGIGTYLPLQNKWRMAFDFSTQFLKASGQVGRDVNILNKFFLGALYPVNSRLELSIGPTADIGIFNSTGTNFKKYFSAYSANYTFSEKAGNTNIRFWVGVRASARFW